MFHARCIRVLCFDKLKRLVELRTIFGIYKIDSLKKMASSSQIHTSKQDGSFEEAPVKTDATKPEEQEQVPVVKEEAINDYFVKEDKVIKPSQSDSKPPLTEPPQVRQVKTCEFNKIVFDLETSSRGDNAEIIQIAATDGKEYFNDYVIPENSISRGASAVNKLSKKRGLLFHGKKKVTAVKLNRALLRFLLWLQTRTPCLLLAHNVRAFDAKHLMKALAKCSETREFSTKVLGFSDTLTAFRELYPERQSYTQENLVKDLLGVDYEAHNALDDVKTLYKLTRFLSPDMILRHSFTVGWFIDYQRFMKVKNKNLESLQPLITAGKLSESMANKAATSGLHYQNLHRAFQENGGQGLRGLLSAEHHDKPRVTNNERVLGCLCEYFTAHVHRK